jgi:chorismate mutase
LGRRFALGLAGNRKPTTGNLQPSSSMTDKEAKAALADCRSRIDVVDRRLVALLNERTRIVEQIGRIKREMELPIYEPKREDEVFANALSSNPGPLPSEGVKRIFERIMDEMRVVQKKKMEEESKC